MLDLFLALTFIEYAMLKGYLAKLSVATIIGAVETLSIAVCRILNAELSFMVWVLSNWE